MCMCRVTLRQCVSVLLLLIASCVVLGWVHVTRTAHVGGVLVSRS
jgi:hypothetical protein